MESEDDNRSIQNEASNRQETLLFLEQQPQSQDNWDTLGQPSGKYDYLVRYKGPENWKSFVEERCQIKGGAGRYGGTNRPTTVRRTYPALQQHERIILSQTEPSSRWIDPQFHPIAVRYQALMQEIESRFALDSGISFNEFAEIQASLTEEEDNAIEQARTSIQQLRKIQQLKLEAVARSACSDNHYSDILPEVHQQTCELNEIDGELFDLVILMRTFHY